MGRIGNKVNDNRIVYFDPNNIHDNYGYDDRKAFVPPDYTDMTLWCNLIVEKSSRLKNQAGGTDASETYYINYDLSKIAEGSDYVSFFQGYDAEKYNYLTTSYTDFDFNEIRKKNMIEGLQVESISISNQNYTCPHVTIKFVDVRGAGFFGREEATHNEYGQLTNLETNHSGQLADNFYSCFVSFPYPRFKLQIKGYYGKPVTYQLTCSNFQGDLNPSTGNFELTVQFIGYEYGVLGDIPFDYVVAAPLTYEGGKYWDEQIQIASANNANDWMLYSENGSGELPCKLFDFFSNIKGEIEQQGDNDINDLIDTDGSYYTLTELQDQIDRLTKILNELTNLKQLLKDNYGADYVTEVVTDTEEYMVIHTISKYVLMTKKIAESYNTLNDLIDFYADKYKGTTITSTIIPNSSTDGYWKPWEECLITMYPFCEYQNNSNDIGGNVIVAQDGTAIMGARVNNADSCVGANIGYFNEVNDKSTYQDKNTPESLTVTSALSEKIYENFTNWEWPVTGQAYARYAGIIDFKGITTIVKERLGELKIRLQEYTSTIDKGPRKTIKDLVGFSPFVANYFKVVMCHLETFIHLFKSTSDVIDGQIQAGLRTPANLGIRNLNYETDVPSDLIKGSNQVPAFPAVYKKYSVEEEIIKTTPDSKDIVASAWIGDFKGSLAWQEKELVDELYLALERVNDNRQKSETATASRHSSSGPQHFSLMAQDVMKAIPRYSYLNKDDLALYTGLRAEAIFGLYNNGLEINSEYASKFGAIDALNLVNQCANSVKLADLTKVNSEGDTLANEIFNKLTNGNSSGQTNPYGFELVKVTNDRQPVFVKSTEDKLEYKYMPGTSSITIIPVDNFVKITTDSLSSNYSWEDKKFKVKDKDNDTYLFTDSLEVFIKYNEGLPDDVTPEAYFAVAKDYTNSQMFNIFNGYNGSVVDTNFGCKEVLMAYDKFSKGEAKVGTMTGDKFQEVTNEYWLMDNYCLDYFRIRRKDIKSYSDAGITESDIVSSDGTIPSSLAAINTIEATNKFITDFMNKI